MGRGGASALPKRGAGKISLNPLRVPGGEAARVWRVWGSQATGDQGAGCRRRRLASPSVSAKVGGIRGRQDPLNGRLAFPGLGTARALLGPVQNGMSWHLWVPRTHSAPTQDVRAPAPAASGAAAGSERPNPVLGGRRARCHRSVHGRKGPGDSRPREKGSVGRGTGRGRAGHERARQGARPGRVRPPGRWRERRGAEERRRH